MPRRRTVLLALAATALLSAGAAFLTPLGDAGEMHSLASPVQTFDALDPDTFTGSSVGDPVLTESTITVPSIGLDVSWMDTRQDEGRMRIPEAPTAGWLSTSSPVGASQGVTILAGHADYPDQKLTEFGHIGSVEKGAPVYITNQDGVVYPYTVVSLQEYNQQELPVALFTEFGEPTLALVTCSGASVVAESGFGYENNTVLLAVPAKK